MCRIYRSSRSTPSDIAKFMDPFTSNPRNGSSDVVASARAIFRLLLKWSEVFSLKISPRRGVGEITVGGGCGCSSTSFLLQSLAMSFLRSLMAESRLDLLDTWLRMPLSTELSRLFRRLTRWLASVVVCRDHGNDLAMSARVSLRQSLLLRLLFVEIPPPPHSRRMSVSWARLDRRRRWFVGEQSWVSFGGEIDVICAAESRLPVPKGKRRSAITPKKLSFDKLSGTRWCLIIELWYNGNGNSCILNKVDGVNSETLFYNI